MSEQWQRLDPRMLLVYPVKELIRFLPVLLGLFVAGTASGGSDVQWQVIGIGVPVGLGVLRYLTTSFRITGGRVELRRGLLNKHVLSTSLDRVRTVDVTASPIHRVLGLTTVRIGTGTASTKEEDRIDLDGLPAARARLLRTDLLHAAPAGDDDAGGPVPAERVVLRFDPRWLRLAPLTSAGLVMTAGVIGVGSQVLDSVGWIDRLDPGPLVDGAAGVSWWLAVPLLLVGAVALVSALAVAGYLVTNWGFTLTHAAGAWHVRRGLLTTRETSLDDGRVRGVTLAEPIGLRLAGGGRLSAIVTGLGHKQEGSSLLVPPAPRGVVAGVAREVLGATGPLDVGLVGHGPRARTRRYSRAVVPAVAVSAALLLAVLLGDGPRWLLALAVAAPLVGLALARDRWLALGHALDEGYVVARSGSLARRRDVLAVDAVIGWNFRSTFFQRRGGLTTLVATTAGGRQAVPVLDVPEDAAVALAAQALPDVVEQFLTPA